MEEIKINVSVRKECGSRAGNRLRKLGKVPGVLYGKGEPTLSVVVDRKELEKVIAHGSRIINLSMGKENLKAIIREVQRSTLKDNILHVDFHKISMTEKITLPVRVETIGEPKCPPEEGVLELHMSEIKVECLAANLLDKFIVDVRQMGPGDMLRVKDIVPPKGVTILEDPEDVVVSVVRPALEVEAEVKLPEEGAEPELITKVKKEEEEGEEGEEKKVKSDKE